MGFKKPFRSDPVVLGERYVKKAEADLNQERQTNRFRTVLLSAIGLVGGVLLGLACLQTSINWSDATVDRPALNSSNAAKHPIQSLFSQRTRQPQAGDFWSGCNAARAAGTAPIYAQEPGYRIEMDGDGDGIACEPHLEGSDDYGSGPRRRRF